MNVDFSPNSFFFFWILLLLKVQSWEKANRFCVFRFRVRNMWRKGFVFDFSEVFSWNLGTFLKRKKTRLQCPRFLKVPPPCQNYNLMQYVCQNMHNMSKSILLQTEYIKSPCHQKRCEWYTINVWCVYFWIVLDNFGRFLPVEFFPSCLQLSFLF